MWTDDRGSGNGGSRSRSVSERERQWQWQIQWYGSESGIGSGSASRSVVAERGLVGATREAEWWRIGECVAAGQQLERERAVAVADAGSVRKCRRTTSTSWAACCVPIECGRH